MPRLLCQGLKISESKETCKGQGEVPFGMVSASTELAQRLWEHPESGFASLGGMAVWRKGRNSKV